MRTTMQQIGCLALLLCAAATPAVMWVDLNMVDFKKGSGVRKIPIDAKIAPTGEVSAKFAPAEPFKWMK